MSKATNDENARHAALRHVESELWDAFYAVEVLSSRIRTHFERTPSGPFHEIYVDEDSTTIWAAGEAQEKLKTLMRRFDEAFDAAKSKPARPVPADPIVAAFAEMDDLAAKADAFLDLNEPDENDAADLDRLRRAWNDAALEAAVTAPTTGAGLVMLLERLAADIERGPSVWQRPAAETAAAEAKKLLIGGAA